ncbi:MAG: SUMF1/EgtB/PvdO family nonheme iron enzyme [Gemmataceae bacterium]
MPSAMTTEDDFLLAILADPAAEDTWLVLADWLEEDGQADRAELLRLQIQLRAEPRILPGQRPERRVRELLGAGVRPCVPEVENSVGMKFALVPAGNFWMGARPNLQASQRDEQPRRLVRLTRPFFLGVHQVTQAQFRAVTRRSPSYFGPSGPAAARVAHLDTSDWPVESVSYHDAVEFLQTLSKRRPEARAGRTYRLPTEAEWEYACRGGVCHSSYAFGPVLRHTDARFDREDDYPMPVGSYRPNLFGLFDMHGNVWEWTADWYDPDYYQRGPAADPPGPKRGSRRVLRGGGWSTPPNLCRSSLRGHNTLDARHDYNGFRVAMSVG